MQIGRVLCWIEDEPRSVLIMKAIGISSAMETRRHDALVTNSATFMYCKETNKCWCVSERRSHTQRSEGRTNHSLVITTLTSICSTQAPTQVLISLTRIKCICARMSNDACTHDFSLLPTLSKKSLFKIIKVDKEEFLKRKITFLHFSTISNSLITWLKVPILCLRYWKLWNNHLRIILSVLKLYFIFLGGEGRNNWCEEIMTH